MWNIFKQIFLFPPQHVFLNFVKISLYCKMINPKLRYMKFRNIIRLKCFAFVGPQLIFFCCFTASQSGLVYKLTTNPQLRLSRPVLTYLINVNHLSCLPFSSINHFLLLSILLLHFSLMHGSTLIRVRLIGPRAEPAHCTIPSRGSFSLADNNRMTFAKCARSAVCHGHPAMHELLFNLKFSFNLDLK